MLCHFDLPQDRDESLLLGRPAGAVENDIDNFDTYCHSSSAALEFQ